MSRTLANVLVFNLPYLYLATELSVPHYIYRARVLRVLRELCARPMGAGLRGRFWRRCRCREESSQVSRGGVCSPRQQKTQRWSICYSGEGCLQPRSQRHYALAPNVRQSQTLHPGWQGLPQCVHRRVPLQSPTRHLSRLRSQGPVGRPIPRC